MLINLLLCLGQGKITILLETLIHLPFEHFTSVKFLGIPHS